VPQTAIREDGGRKVVFLVNDKKLERRAVTLGNQRGDEVEIMAGIQPGDVVVVRGSKTLRDGETVALKQ
jgi:multidrug efflux pump subunit AcrA (membrane-fusion protein)